MKKYIYFASARVVFVNGEEAYVNQLCASERMLVDRDALQKFNDAFEEALVEETRMEIDEFIIVSLNFLHTVEGGVH